MDFYKPNRLIDIDKKIESGFASLKISNSTESTLPKIDDTPQREVVYKHESKSDDNKSSKDGTLICIYSLKDYSKGNVGVICNAE